MTSLQCQFCSTLAHVNVIHSIGEVTPSATMIHTFTKVAPTAICKLHDASVDDKLNAYDIPMIQSNESIWVNGETNENSNSEII